MEREAALRRRVPQAGDLVSTHISRLFKVKKDFLSAMLATCHDDAVAHETLHSENTAAC